MTDFVYIFRNAAGHRKIGVSNNPISRLNSIQTGNSEAVAFEAHAECERAYDVEAAMHAMFPHRRLQGEWFNITFAEAWEAFDRAWVQVLGHLADPYQWFDPLRWPMEKASDGLVIEQQELHPIMPAPPVGESTRGLA